MAMSSTIRKASHTVIPLALRAIASPKNLSSSVIKADDDHGGVRLVYTHHPNFPLVSGWPRRVDEKLVEELKSEIGSICRSDERMPKVPTGFPFEVQDIPGENTIKLTREFAGEKIVVEVENPIYGEITWRPTNRRRRGDHLPTDPSDDEESEKRHINFYETFIPLHVNVSKRNGRTLRVVLAADSDYIEPQKYFIDERKRIFNEVKLDQKDYWREFIRVRGIEDSIGDFLIKYMTRRQDREYLRFLKRFRNFVEE